MKKVSKSAQIRALYEQGMSNKQITEALGFKKLYVVQITGNYRRLLKASGKSIETHGTPAYFFNGLSPSMSHPKVGDVAYVRNLKQPKKSSVLSRFWEVVRWICTGRVDL
jgi:hypothetical protein